MHMFLTFGIFVGLFLLQALEPFGLKDLIGQASTPISVGIVIVGYRWMFQAWREDTQQNRQDQQKYFETLKEFITSLENERKAELADFGNSFDNLANSIREFVAKKN